MYTKQFEDMDGLSNEKLKCFSGGYYYVNAVVYNTRRIRPVRVAIEKTYQNL